ncbi:MAG: MazG nucleotide pyrophosphohydrolase domain-containing protein [Patescibacteria group bacterium]
MTIQELQAQIKLFTANNHLDSSPESRILDTMSELGEVAKEMLKMTDYGKQPMQFREEMKMELGDVLYSLITTANALDVNLEEALQIVIAKYETRLARGGAGSENEVL